MDFGYYQRHDIIIKLPGRKAKQEALVLLSNLWLTN